MLYASTDNHSSAGPGVRLHSQSCHRRSSRQELACKYVGNTFQLVHCPFRSRSAFLRSDLNSNDYLVNGGGFPVFISWLTLKSHFLNIANMLPPTYECLRWRFAFALHALIFKRINWHKSLFIYSLLFFLAPIGWSEWSRQHTISTGVIIINHSTSWRHYRSVFTTYWRCERANSTAGSWCRFIRSVIDCWCYYRSLICNSIHTSFSFLSKNTLFN